MEAANVFTLDVSADDTVADAKLLFRGAAVGTVYGSRVDAQFRLPGLGYLLFVSFGHMFSAVETIYFSSLDGQVRDRVRLGHSTEEGLISDIAIVGEDTVSFQFPLSERRRVRVGRRAEWFGLKTRWLTLE